MPETAQPGRGPIVAVAVAALLVAAVAVIVVWDPLGALVRAVDLPDSVSLDDLPDVPKWLFFALGKVKFVLIAGIVLAVAVKELRKRSRGGDGA